MMRSEVDLLITLAIYAMQWCGFQWPVACCCCELAEAPSLFLHTLVPLRAALPAALFQAPCPRSPMRFFLGA